jgi:hypothetical protein
VWPTALGGLLLVPGPNQRLAVVLLPDSAPDADALAAVRGAPVELFGPAGRMGSAAVAGVEREEDPECVRWPSARLQFGADSSGAEWTLAARTGTATAVPYRALATVPPRDSAALVVDIARVASGLSDDTAATFRGLPVVVRAAVRARFGAVDVIVAEVARRVGQGATPLEERVALVAERDTTPGARWVARWWVRVDGTEETIEASDVAGVVAIGDALAVVLQRESTRGVRYELLWRASGTWTRWWTGAWSGC